MADPRLLRSPFASSLGWLRTPSIITSAVSGMGGLAFVLATLIMGRVLDDHTFSEVVVMLALSSISIEIAPAGLAGITLRHDLRSDLRLLAAGSVAVAIAGLAVSAAGVIIYHLDWVSATVLVAAILAGGTALLGRAAFLRAQQFSKVAVLYQIVNVVLLFAALSIFVGVGRKPWFPSLVVGAWYAVLGIGVWRAILAHHVDGRRLEPSMWRDAVNFAGVTLSGEVLMQLERLLLPLTLSSTDLALYAIAAAMALAPYRMLAMGTSATLTARLRHAPAGRKRRMLLLRESALVLVLSIVGGAAILLVGPWIGRWVRPEGGVPLTLLMAIIVGGIARILATLANGAAASVCSGRELQRVNMSGWVAVILAALAGWLLSRYGLVWLVLGVTVGWAVRALVAASFTRQHL